MRDERHIVKHWYTFLSNKFYEPFEHLYSPSSEFLEIIKELLKKQKREWKIIRDGIWYHIFPKGFLFPIQGWKIHVSATIKNAQKILSNTAEILIKNGIPFKFVLDKKIFLMMHSKAASRSSSGKFITIYPQNESIFKEIMEILYQKLKEEEGPYILSDRRYKDCKVLYYRYGGIKNVKMIDIIGRRQYFLKTPDDKYIKDERTPYFNLPYWVEDPFENMNYKEPSELSLKEGKYLIKEALHFSNTGGVYLAKDRRTNKKVIIKEARPFTCMNNFGDDAVKLIYKEYEILKVLSKYRIAPKPLDLFKEWEHAFLVMEYANGKNIRELFFSKTQPFLKAEFNKEESLKFYELYRRVFINLVNAFKIAHQAGIILGDISPYNIIFTKNYKVVRTYGAQFFLLYIYYKNTIDILDINR